MALISIEDPHTPVNLEFEMKGPIFDPGLPIPLTIRSLESLQGIVDRSYLVLAHKQQISAQDRSLFYLRSQSIAHGSLFTTLGLVYSAVQPALPIISNLGPTGIWEYAKAAFEFIKIVFEAKKAGDTVTITQTGNGLVNVNTGSQSFVFNGPVYHIANASLTHYEFLAKQLAPERVTDIRLGYADKRDIALDLSDRELFELPTTMEEKQHDVKGELFEFDKYDGTGRLNVPELQPIAKGEYRFNVMGRQELSNYIEAMLHKQVIVTCLEEIVDHPIVGRKVVSLHVLKVRS